MTGLVTAVVCTHNRSRDALECVRALLDGADDSLSVVLVDSASSEEHTAALREFCDRHEAVHLERCDTAGLSIARNRAAEVVDTDWLAFLDDDARPSRDWWRLANEAAREAPDDVAVIGGRILPGWPGQRPPYVGKRWLMFLSCIEEERQDERPEDPECYGANLMVRSTALKSVGGFPRKLGRVGDVLLSGEENRLQVLLRRRGARVQYDGRLVVTHLIDPERLTRQWVRQRAFWGGFSEVLAAQQDGVTPLHLHPVKAALALGILRIARVFGDPESDKLIRASYATGVLAGWWRTTRESPS